MLIRKKFMSPNLSLKVIGKVYVTYFFKYCWEFPSNFSLILLTLKLHPLFLLSYIHKMFAFRDSQKFIDAKLETFAHKLIRKTFCSRIFLYLKYWKSKCSTKREINQLLSRSALNVTILRCFMVVNWLFEIGKGTRLR